MKELVVVILSRLYVLISLCILVSKLCFCTALPISSGHAMSWSSIDCRIIQLPCVCARQEGVPLSCHHNVMPSLPEVQQKVFYLPMFRLQCCSLPQGIGNAVQKHSSDIKMQSCAIPIDATWVSMGIGMGKIEKGQFFPL